LDNRRDNCYSVVSTSKAKYFPTRQNEVFKTQVQDIQALLNDLNWKSHIDAWEHSGLKASSDISIDQIFREYARDRLGAEIENGTEHRLAQSGMIVSPNARLFRKIVGPADEAIRTSSHDEPSRRTYDWEAFEWETFPIGSQLENTILILEGALSNPILPTLIINCIQGIRNELHETCVRSAEDIAKIAHEFPRHYDTAEKLEGADLTWARNMRIERGEKLFLSYMRLKQEVRKYLKTDSLFGN
jgi:hypothetical protein